MFTHKSVSIFARLLVLIIALFGATAKQASAQLLTLPDMMMYFAPCTDTRVPGFYFQDLSTRDGRSAFLRVSDAAGHTVQLQLYAVREDNTCERVYPYDRVETSQLEIELHEVPGLQDREFSLKVALHWGRDMNHTSATVSSYLPGLQEGGMDQGVESLFNEVHFAEGAFNETITVFNPTDLPVHLLFEFMDEAGNVYPRYSNGTVAAAGRRKFNINDEFFGGQSFSHSTRIRAFFESNSLYNDIGGPVIAAEREIITPGGAVTRENGVQPRMTWNGAEGSKGSYFHTYLLMSNPNYTPTDVLVFFFHENGQTYSVKKTLLPTSRFTLDVNSEQSVPDGNFAYRVYVLQGNPIVVERAVYWGLKNGGWQGAHVAAGSPENAVRWHFAEGNTSGPFHTFLLIDNKAPENKVTLSFRILGVTDGGVIHHSMVLDRYGRWTFDLAELVPAIKGKAFALEVNSEWHITAEEAMYWMTSVGGETRMGGSVATGRPVCNGPSVRGVPACR